MKIGRIVMRLGSPLVCAFVAMSVWPSPALAQADHMHMLTPQQQQACLAQALEDVNWALGRADTAARAWAVGDIKTVKAHYSEWRLGNCVIGAVQRFSDIDGRNIAEYVSATDAALNKPGKTIVVIHMGPLLRKNGVLEGLQARGIAIEGPAE